MSTLRVAICEDFEPDAVYLRWLIGQSEIAAEISCFTSGEQFLASRPGGRFDLVFVDIYMGGVSGVEAAVKLRESDEDCGIVFTTTSEDHRPEAFDVGADHYLVKPVDSQKLDRVLKKRLKSQKSAQNILTINVKSKGTEIPHDNILFIEGRGRDCYIHTADGVIDGGSAMKIEDFALHLKPPRFMRCHQSYIVNLSHVDRLERDFIMKNGQTVYIRRGDLAKCKQYERELDKWRLAEAGRDG